VIRKDRKMKRELSNTISPTPGKGRMFIEYNVIKFSRPRAGVVHSMN